MVKKLKSKPLTARDLLVDVAPPDLAARWRNRPHVVDDLFDLVFADDVGDQRVPLRAASVVCCLGRAKELFAEWLQLMADLDKDGVEFNEDAAVNAGAIALGDHADPADIGPLLLDVLDDGLVSTGAPFFCWITLLEPLSRFGERGWRDERGWGWFERLRPDDPLLWCAFIGDYGDDRAVPFLDALLDAHGHALDDLDHFDHEGDGGLAVEALGARLSYQQPLRPIDAERSARLDAWRLARIARP